MPRKVVSRTAIFLDAQGNRVAADDPEVRSGEIIEELDDGTLESTLFLLSGGGPEH